MEIANHKIEVFGVDNPGRVIIDDLPDGFMPISLSYHSRFSTVRICRVADNTIKNISDVWRLENTEDPFRFKLAQRLTDAEHDGVLGYEDPTVISLNGNVLVAVTRVTESTKLYRGGWEGRVDLINPETLEKRPLAWSVDKLYPNLGYYKEMQVVENGSPFWHHAFFEAGGPRVGALIITGNVNLDSGRCRNMGIWLEPRWWWWTSTKVQYWDSTHLAPGPVIKLDDGSYLMFYNGRTEGIVADLKEELKRHSNGMSIDLQTSIAKYPEWACGAIVFAIEGSKAVPRIIARSEEPLIRDPARLAGYTEQIIYFCSDIRPLETGQYVLYGHIGDQHIVGHRLTVTKL